MLITARLYSIFFGGLYAEAVQLHVYKVVRKSRVNENVSHVSSSQGCVSSSELIWLWMGSMQTDSLKGSEVSLDDASPANLERLVQTAQDLLNDEVATRDLDTGELKAIGTGETNRTALQRCWISYS